MRISEFSKRNGVSIRTLRYYILQQLIIPKKRSGYLEFGVQCEKEIELIKRLKCCGFSIDEMREWMRQERMEEPAKRKHFQKAFLEKKEQYFHRILEEQDRQLQRVIQKKQELEIHISRSKMGSSIRLMPLVCCPHCREPLEYTGIHIADNQILHGEGACSCGYRILIRDGIFIVQGRAEESLVLASLDSNRETYNRMQADEVTTMQRSFNWIIKRLQEMPLEGKVVFENSVNVVSLFSTGIAALMQSPRYIISDSDYHTILDFKQRIEALEKRPDMLYLVCDSFDYPLREGSIDVLVDYYTSEVLQRYPISSLADQMCFYLHQDSILAGAYTFVEKGAGTFFNNRKAYPDSYPGRYQLENYKKELARCDIVIVEEAKVNLYDASNAIPAFKEGDLLGDYCYIGRKQ